MPVTIARSTLFAEYEYLVAYVEDSWLGELMPSLDAISTPMVGPEAKWPQPPLVFIPESRRRSRSHSFRSIVEHEFVHINQALLGILPEWPVGRRADDLIEHLLAYTRAEYEASLLQLTRWPGLYEPSCGLSLDHWCVLRGYSQALEKILVVAAQSDFPPD